MTLPPKQSGQSETLYQLIVNNALDAFIAIDKDSRIIEWTSQAEKIFGWTREEAIGTKLPDTIIPQRYHEAHYTGLARYLSTGMHNILGKRIELQARRKDGSELPVELTVTPLQLEGKLIFSGALRDITARRELEAALAHQARLTKSIIENMVDAVVVADTAGKLIMANPAAQRLLDLHPGGKDADRAAHSLALLPPEGEIPYAPHAQPLNKALAGEEVHQLPARVRGKDPQQTAWVTVNAAPLMDSAGQIIGAVAVLHDITEMRQRQDALAQQTSLLQEQATLLDLTRDAIMVRNAADDVITYWNKGAARLYHYTHEQAVGQVSHRLLATRFPVPLEQIRETVARTGHWEGELNHLTRNGQQVTVYSQWVLEMQGGHAIRYLETNTDITERVQAENALRQSQQDYQLLVESSTEYAIIMIDPGGTIRSWNTGAERILGYAPHEAIGKPIDIIFTREDRERDMPLHERNEARTHGRAEDDRWHMRRDGSRFFAAGITTPSWNPDGGLRGYVKIMRDRTAQRMAEEQTHFLANHDALTGLPNRVRFSNELHQAIALSERNNRMFALLLLDLDKFKYVNDTFGHHTGDLMLKEVALRIRSSLRETDFVARLGGDEFVVMQRDVSQPGASEILAGKLVKQLGQPYLLEANEVMSGTSVGIAIYPKDAQNPVELMKRADLALYRAKHAGRHNYQFYTSELAADLATREDRAQTLRRALQNHQFELYYQPQIDLNSWRISTVEALLRWHASDLDLLTPDEFLEVAEDTGVIVDIGIWALRQACEQVRHWQQQGLSDLRISVNCSARQFSDPAFVDMMPGILHEAGLSPSSLELEVPESLLAKRPEIKEQLAALRALGIRITLDNFGTGNTALRELQGLEIDSLKIDKAFVRHLPHRREDSAVAAAIISLARNLGIGVVAGGVETAEQLAYLKSRECTSAQGFIFSPPVTADRFEALLLNGNWSRLNRLSPTGDMEAFNNLH